MGIAIRHTFLVDDVTGKRRRLTRLDVTRDGFGAISKGAFNRVLKEAMEDAGEFWHREILPKHFTTAGAKEYNYKVRQRIRRRKRQDGSTYDSPGYEQYKMRKKGHRKPLVWSGDLRRAALSEAAISGTSKGFTVKLTVPNHVIYRGRSGRGPDMRRELTTVSGKDLRLITEFLEKRIREIMAGGGRAAGRARRL